MKKVFKWAGYILLPLVILIVIGLLNWESITYYGLRKAAHFLAGGANIELAIGKFSGNPFSRTKVEHIAIRPDDGQPQTYSFKTQSITCTYNLRDLREGYEFFLQGLSCKADTPEFAYDFKITAPEEQSSGEPKQFLLPEVLPKIQIHNGTVFLLHNEWDVQVRGINSSLRSITSGHELQLAVERFQFIQGGMPRIDTGLVSMLQYAEEKLIIDSLKLGEERISATGLIDLAKLDIGNFEFAADVTFTESQLGLKGSLANRLLQVNAETDNFDIVELQQLLGGSGWEISGKIRGKAELAFNLETREDLHGSYAVALQKGRVRGMAVEAVSATGSFDNEIFNISIAEARTPDNQILVKDVSAPMHLLQGGNMLSILGGGRAVFTTDIENFATFMSFVKVGEDLLPEAVRPNSVTVVGHLEKGVLYIDRGKAVTADSALTIDKTTIPIPATKEAFESVTIDLTARIESSNLQALAGLFADTPLSGRAAADLRITGSIKEPKANINLTGASLGYKKLQLGTLSLQGDIRIVQEKTGKIKSIEVEISELTQENDFGILGLLLPIAGTWEDDTFAMNASFQLDGKGEIAAEFSRTPGKAITVGISTRNLDSDGWLGNFMDNSYFFHGADIEAALLGLFESPELQLSGTIGEAGGTGVPFPLAGNFGLHYSSKGIEIMEFTWKSHERNKLSLSGYLPYDPMAMEPFLDNDMSVKGHIAFPALEDIAILLEPWGIGKGNVAVDLDLSGSWDRPEGHVHFQAEGIEPPNTMRQYLDSAVNVSFDIAALGGAIVLQAASLESQQYSAEATGSWKHGISVKEFLQKHKAELTGEVIVDAQLQFKDLNFLRQKLPWLRRLEGDLQGELHVSGPVTKPTLKGSFSLKDGEASHTFNFPMLSVINLQGDFDEHSITIRDMRTDVGGSPVNLNGRINRAREAVAVSLHIDGTNVLLFRNNDMRMRGDVQLDVTGPLERLAIKGTTSLTSGYYTRNIDFLGMVGSSSAPVSEGAGFLFSFTDPPLKDAVFDIRITSTVPFRIRNNLVRGVLRPELSLKGTGELPFLVGTVYIDPSRVLLPSGGLQVQSGLLHFPAGNPDRPQLDLVAQSRVLGYDISVITRGPLDNPVITLSSSPALPNDDLMLLLLTGQPPREDIAGGTRSSAPTNVMVYLGRDFLNKWLEDESGASDETIFDRFELDFGRGVTKSGEQTVESTFRLSEYTAGTGTIYYLSGEKDKYDAYNYGLKVVFRFE